MDPLILLITALVLFILGIIISFDLVRIIRDSMKEKNAKRQMMDAASSGKKNITDTVNYYQGKKGFYVAEELNSARAILNETGRGSEFAKTAVSCIVLCLAGVLIGLVMRNIFAIAILGIAFFLIPVWRLKLYRNKYRRYLSAQLESCTTLITTSYIRNNDIVKSVEENLEQLSPLIRPYFQDFLNESRVNPSLKNCVRNLRDKINESIFKEWCETLIRTLDNSEMKETLLPIANKYSSVRVVQQEIDAETFRSLIEYIIMAAMTVLAYPLVYILNRTWFAYYSTFFGHFVVGYTLLVLFISIIRLISVMTPVEYKR